jgi:hypothetical protein
LSMAGAFSISPVVALKQAIMLSVSCLYSNCRNSISE